MTHEHDDELEAEDPARLEALRREWLPPSDFEDRTVAALTHLELIQPEARNMTQIESEGVAARGPGAARQRNRLERGARFALPIAASLVLFVGGFMSGRIVDSRTESTAAPAPATSPQPGAAPVASQPSFMLLLWERKGVFDAPENASAEYGAWARAQAGLVIDGAELASTARVLAPPSVGSTDAPHRDAAGAAVAGYFVIQAADAAEAARIAATCPHVKYGGTIEIRQLVGS